MSRERSSEEATRGRRTNFCRIDQRGKVQKRKGKILGQFDGRQELNLRYPLKMEKARDRHRCGSCPSSEHGHDRCRMSTSRGCGRDLRLPLALARLSGRSSITHSPFRSPPRRLRSKLPKVLNSKDKAAAAATLDGPVLRDAWRKHTSAPVRSSRSPFIFGKRLGPDD